MINKNGAKTRLTAGIGQRLSPEAVAQEAAVTHGDLIRFLKDKLSAALRPDAMERMLNRKYGDGSMSPNPRHEDTAMEEPVTASIPQQMLLDAYKRSLKAGRSTGTAAGALFYAKDTGRFLFVKRSDRGDCAGTWGVPGGGVEDFETIEEAVRREADEEVGYNEPYDLIHMHRDVQPDGFTFHNHMAVVPNEFEPRLNDEHTAYVWSEEMPEPMHPRLALSIDAWSQRNRQDNPQA